MTSAGSPRFSLISAVYGVAGFLEDFIASIEKQTFPLDRVQVVMVDDGSADGSAEILQQWAARRPELVTVLTQANAGQAAARNLGLEHAAGEWVSFPDPDDVVPEDYLENVDRFIGEHDEVDLVAASTLIRDDSTGEVGNRHPLRYMFQRDRLVDLDADGQYFPSSATAAFFRRDRLERAGTRFDGRLRPASEDGHFTGLYLLTCDRPMAGFLKSAQYHQRERHGGTSSLQSSRTYAGGYAETLELGHLDLSRRALERHGRLPRWLQAFLAYELQSYFTFTDAQLSGPVPTAGPVANRVHASIRELLAVIDLDRVVAGGLPPLGRIQRYVLQHAYAAEPWHEDFVLYTDLDRRQRLVQATYFFTGEQPHEEVFQEGVRVSPQHAKTVELSFCGQVLLRRRVLWVASNRKTVIRLGGQDIPVVYGRRPPDPVTVATPGAMRHRIGPRSGLARKEAEAFLPLEPTTKEGRKARRLHARPRTARRYHHAWVLMDRIHDAADSGEILFRHLRAHHPEINAWFVLEEGTPDWKRLRTEGYADRLVAHGSMQWRLLMAHALHLISSHADEAIVSPPAVLEFVRPQWKFTFLQHGVIKDDLSAWLNRKKIDTFVTSTPQEFASIAGDSTYVFSTREVKLTGMPRFDRLHEVGQRFGPGQRDLVLVAPTWRKELLPTIEAGTQRRTVDVDAINQSAFMQQWRAFLGDDTLRAAAERHGARVAFLPHPNLQPVLAQLGLPGHVDLLSYDGADVQEYFARARTFVTDFSSVAFNEAYLERPVVYFQFDEETVLGGGHVGRAGYYDYRRDGFGPVTTTASEAVTAVVAALDHGPTPMEPFASRIDATFPERDGQSCERVVAAIRRSMRNRSQDPPEPTPVLRAAASADTAALGVGSAPPGSAP